MTPLARQDYLKALDIPDFLFLSDEAKIQPGGQVRCLVVEAETQHSFCQPGESYDLLEKMLGAIDLSMTSVKCASATNQTLANVVTQNPARAVLIMGDLTASTLGKVYATHHPHDILKNPGLKRQAWEVLKEVKKCLK